MNALRGVNAATILLRGQEPSFSEAYSHRHDGHRRTLPVEDVCRRALRRSDAAHRLRMYLIYSLLLVLTAVVGSPWFAWQAMRHRKYVGSVRERLGRLPVSLNLDGEPSIWVHAVSVGEVLAARPLVESLRVRYPGLRLFVS